MKEKVYVLSYSLQYDYEGEEKISVYSTPELAREAMLADIKESKLDNFWWDKRSGNLCEGFVAEEGEYGFDVYLDGEYSSQHERWSIGEYEVFSDLNRSQKKETQM